MKKPLFIYCLLFAFAFSIEPVDAKTLPQAKASGKSVTKPGVVSGISVYPRIRNDRRALVVSFNNLQNANSVSYTLIYRTEGREEGAGGSVRTSEGNSASRELLFGTCSKNICRYHTNITNMRFEVTSQLKIGKTSTKRYRIKI